MILEKFWSASFLPAVRYNLLYCGIIALSVEAVKTPIIMVGIENARKKPSVKSDVP